MQAMRRYFSLDGSDKVIASIVFGQLPRFGVVFTATYTNRRIAYDR